MEEVAYAKAEMEGSGRGHVGKRGGGWDGKGKATGFQGGFDAD